MNEITIYFLVVATAIVSFLMFTVKALAIYQNVWILAYTLLVGLMISFVLIAIKPFSTDLQDHDRH